MADNVPTLTATNKQPGTNEQADACAVQGRNETCIAKWSIRELASVA